MNNIIFSLFGHDKSNKLDIAAIICREIGLELIVIDISLIADLDTSFHDILDLVFRESLLIPAGVYFSNIDFLFNNEEKEVNTRKLFLSILNGKSRLSFVSTENSVNALGNLDNQQLIEINFPVLEYNDRLKSWQKNLSKIDSVSKDIMLNELAVKFKFTDEQIKNAIYIAKNNAAWREGDKGKLIITIDDLYQGCYAESSQKLKELSQKIIPKYKLEDIILPEDEKSHINEIINYVKNKYIVLDKWGFSKKLSLGKGLCVLFYGPTGTGKTMSSEILANELKMELFRVDLSTIVSKYVGETEKNLSRIFDAAEMSNAILFFDEADAIFGKRSEIKDAHDRYANIEVGYLLQKIDEYTGVVVLSTNFIKNIDDAFLRRLQFIVHYPFPDVQYRKNIWQKIFPKEMPIDKKSINYDFLAEKIKFAGGNIKNIALLAAFLAAEKNESVTMNHIMLSAKREFQKLNKEWEYSDVMKEYKQIKIVSK